MLLSRFLSRSHVLTTFLSSVLGAMMKQVCWHSRRSKAYRGLPEARGQSEAHGTRIYKILWLGSLSLVWQWDTVVPSGLAKILFVKAAPVFVKNVNPSTPLVYPNRRFHKKHYARRKHLLWLRLRSYLLLCNVK